MHETRLLLGITLGLVLTLREDCLPKGELVMGGHQPTVNLLVLFSNAD